MKYTSTEIIAIIAIIAPTATAIITCIFNVIIKKIEFRQKRYEEEFAYKRELFCDFLECANSVVLNVNLGDSEKILNLSNRVMLYVPFKDSDFFLEYIGLITAEEFNGGKCAQLLRLKIIPCIKKELRSASSLRRR